MPAAIADAPAVAMSFANNFWGKDDAGVGPLLDRMINSKQTCDELKSFYGARAAIEDEYARKLLNLSKKSLGTHESGTLKASLDTRSRGGNKERRKIIQNTVEKLLKVKVQQTNQVNKTRDKYEQECLKIKGYLAQGHMVMGQEERRNKAKLEKTQISLATSNTEYENAVKVLEETTVRWNREWKAAADKFQDLEEERLDFTKNSLWTFANIASTVCVSDDASCEKIRLSLESMDVETDIITFITERGTGQEIPEAPKYINFVRGDVHDTQSEASEDEHNYTVAQFPRNPPVRPTGRDGAATPQKSPQKLLPAGRPSMDEQHRKQQPPSMDDRYRKQPPAPEDQFRRQLPPAEEQQQQQYGRQPPAADDQYRRQPPAADDQYRRQPPATEEQFRRSQTGSQPPSPYDSLHQSPKPSTPHDPYPKDGMTMLCRPGASSASSPQIQSARASGRDSRSEYSDPTSISSQEPQSGKMSPVKQDPPASASPDNRMLKKKSGFFQNHSPFRRKSTKDLQAAAAGNGQPSNRNTWHPSQSQGSTSPVRRPQPYGNSEPQTRNLLKERTASPEPIDANASLALGVGSNVLPVTTPDTSRQRPQQPVQKAEPEDPIAAALAELKNVNVGKQASVRMSADHYHGISTPVPNTDAAVTRGPPPPSYQAQTQVTRLGVPPPAVTSRAMKEATQKITGQGRSIFGGDDGRRGQVDIQFRQTLIMTIGETAPQLAYRSRIKGTTAAHLLMGRLEDRPGVLRQTHTEEITIILRAVRRAVMVGLKWRYNWLVVAAAAVMIDMARLEVEALYAQVPAPWAYTTEGISEAGVSPIPRGNILEMADQFYIWAAIPEELGFAKGDYLAVYRHQDDGWWEAEVHNGNGQIGLVPSNYLQQC
ncbi:hypothetical protein TrVGV298_004250 [Trichoderma virens]|nr:hypothetical protein TrVGV298_004250 [Trichoderma virens]